MRTLHEQNAKRIVRTASGDALFRVWDDNGVIWCPRIEDEVSWVIRIVFCYGIRKPPAWVVVPVKHIFYTVSGLRASQASPDNLKSPGIGG